jgi:hypothetical protein
MNKTPGPYIIGDFQSIQRKAKYNIHTLKNNMSNIYNLNLYIHETNTTT